MGDGGGGGGGLDSGSEKRKARGRKGGSGMTADGEDTRWMCGSAGMAASLHRVNLHRVSSIVREIRDPCLHRSPAKGSKMLKPDKWQAIFGNDGRALCFRKALKLIVLGGVDPSIRAEVWEFLLGCYALSTTTEHRKQLRMARRERYEELIRQCQMMHSSIGTGSLAYAVGSKVMDMRTLSKDNDFKPATSDSGHASHSSTNKVDTYPCLNKDCEDASYGHRRAKSSDSAKLVGSKWSKDNAEYSSCFARHSSGGSYDYFDTNAGSQNHEPAYASENYIDFPPLPVTNLFQKSYTDGNDCEMYDARLSVAENFEDEHMHSFHINNNVDLIRDSNGSCTDLFQTSNSSSGIFMADVEKNSMGSKGMDCKSETLNKVRISDAPEAVPLSGMTSSRLNANEDRVSEWLWTLHRIVVDVVRTDSHLEFYGDSKNMARMSDILAVYAWVDPATGYCQGMSDLLSPFIVLYEDNADAFWCFEMLLRRMRENFQMEGPTGVMKQLQALWKILEHTDTEMYEHLSLIGAESLHFAFRMLLVLFRRELTFNEALRMWEMMWAADFDEAVAQQLEGNCLEPLVLHLPEDLNTEMKAESTGNGKVNIKGTGSEDGDHDPCPSYSNGVKSVSSHPLCGLTRANFWARQDQLHISTIAAPTRNGDDDMPVFCVAAILIINRHKIMRQTHSIDDVIKMFNDNRLKINVKRCVRMAIKLRKKYFCKLIRQTDLGFSEQ
ncbi:small G protein signaling modulator 1-like [Dioscorea cayenensis subsp. rotundata]|uniref:Small G protein signaling modulator 1-like n=1 Tax=Dioscorea cayennensis subsp. rotundata TaxID=55577 RepID=A0AB40BTX2_DIOCR|nr:small G protein signaling modulator 1-like [Dioscorea cayenensis subsp. rotundata]XP_039130311.1 small G protein signaling modulator 1-like [Dioscorea cayenensis subsp. rotundata]XP_039130312.1 small G protein signaling modulator 1-like [Dioscorea cayenensis subsp. rotundata]